MKITSAMEKQIKIKVSEKHYAYGRMTGTTDQPLFIVVHGLADSMDEDLYLDATRWFATHGYATCRFNLYGAEKDARQMIDTTLETHASDIDTIVRYFRRKKFKKVFIAGHSYGGPSILLSKEQKFDGAVLWDPSYGFSFTKAPATYIKQVRGYLMKWGINFIVGKAMADEADALAWDSLAKDFHVPLAIIAAGNGYLVRGAKQYFKTANAPKELHLLKGASHHFNDTENMREELFKLSDRWFKKCG